jgi:hypothetical protein
MKKMKKKRKRKFQEMETENGIENQINGNVQPV